MISEEFLHYVWQHKLFYAHQLSSIKNEKIEIIDIGSKNTNDGPDFFNAKIKIGEQIWVGNVEIHLKSSDWYKHKHDKNPLYDSVILHVVKEADSICKRTNGEEI